MGAGLGQADWTDAPAASSSPASRGLAAWCWVLARAWIALVALRCGNGAHAARCPSFLQLWFVRAGVPLRGHDLNNTCRLTPRFYAQAQVD